ncbi:hypothetical protein DMX04_23415 [Pseudomonas koreensis]|nr:hypothetical protein DMX04_23415 [Pseudomonas koreensis]
MGAGLPAIGPLNYNSIAWANAIAGKPAPTCGLCYTAIIDPIPNPCGSWLASDGAAQSQLHCLG